MAFEDVLDEYAQRKKVAYAMGGSDKLAKRREQGRLNARERLDVLLDEGSFFESGLFAKGIRPEARHKTPADGKIAGFGRVDGREIAVISNDFTVVGATSSAVNGKKIRHMREVASKRGLPLVFLGESAGARMPDRMGAAGRAMLGQDAAEYLRDRKTPWVSALLGDCYGSSTWYACMSDFVVMRKGSTLAVASTRVTSVAINQPVEAEDLGGWRLHTGSTGLVDLAVDTDEEALEAVRVFLSYLPRHNSEMPPRQEAYSEPEKSADHILEILPETRNAVYDVRDILRCVVDGDSLFELKARFGKSICTSLARIEGRSVGILANNPKFKGGAIDVDAMRKAVSFLVLCDSYNVPVVFMVDQPGFLIGIDGEKRWAPGRIMNWMNAISLVSTPKISVIMRKSYGQAYLNMGGGRNSDEVLSWPMADLGFVDPALGVQMLHKVKRSEDPERFDELLADLKQDSTAYSLAELYETHAIIDPRETRQSLARLLEVHALKGEVGEHKLATWPTSY